MYFSEVSAVFIDNSKVLLNLGMYHFLFIIL